MSQYKDLTKSELEKLQEALLVKYDSIKAKGLALDMSRGKPGNEQLDLSMGLYDVLEPNDYKGADGVDCRNYGGPDGIPEIRQIFADILEVDDTELIIGGNSSLTLMYESLMAQKLSSQNQQKRKFLCPSPGYDRHFAITEYLGYEMIPIKMTLNGPDMAEIEEYAKDPLVAGVWCVPKFSNPQGVVYTDETIRKFAKLKPAAADFRIIWDNAYCIHAFDGETPKILNLLEECKRVGNYDLPLMYTSFSKVTFPGAAVAAMAASPANVAKIRKHLSYQLICQDKMNQLRHARLFKNADGVYEHMKKHAEILKPRFEAVLSALTGLDEKGIGAWFAPKGGYFVSFDAMPGTATKIVKLCAEAGVITTPAGAAFPYGNDPLDRNIRIAPTFPSSEQLKQAMELFCVAVELVSVQKLLEN
ncbi:MAG: aminotransferase class I/II-fold pyridoxal phosphate-dependent enzyme [Turicibacter sp.]|nr:aminotransferase class I/II-fold pyridoxal phosphate-dependent enzyme [Turicibacter sp.]